MAEKPGKGRDVSAMIRRAMPAAGLILFTLLTSFYFGSGRADTGRPVLRAFPLDDSYIHLVYADSLAKRGRLEYNPGEPEAGMSSFLWVLLEAPFLFVANHLDWSPILAVHLLNLIIALLLALTALAWTRGIFGGRLLPYAAAGAMLLEPALAMSRFSGMEVLLSALTLAAAYEWWRREKLLAAGVLLGLAVAARPENSILLAMCLGMDALHPDRIKRIALLAAPSAIILGIWALHNFNATGNPLPNTVIAKSALGLKFGEAGKMVAYMVFKLSYFRLIAGFSLYILGVGLMYKKGGHRTLVAAVFPWVYILGTACTRPHLFSYWAYCLHRYFQPCIPFLFIPWIGGAGWIIKAAAERIRFRGPWRTWQNALLAAGLAAFLSSVLPLPGRMAYWQNLLAWNCQNIEEVQVKIAKWVSQNTKPDAVIASFDAGAIRYYGGRYVLDYWGLNTHGMLKGPKEYFLNARPDYLIKPVSDQDPPPPEGIVPVFSAISENYTLMPGYLPRQTVFHYIY